MLVAFTIIHTQDYVEMSLLSGKQSEDVELKWRSGNSELSEKRQKNDLGKSETVKNNKHDKCFSYHIKHYL